MRGHNVCFIGLIRKIIPITPSYLELCYLCIILSGALFQVHDFQSVTKINE